MASTAISKCENKYTIHRGKKYKDLIYCSPICQSTELWGTATEVLINSSGLMNRYRFPNFYCCTTQSSDCQANAKVQVPFEWHIASVNQRDVTKLNYTSRQNKNTECQISPHRTRYASAHVLHMSVLGTGSVSGLCCQHTFPNPSRCLAGWCYGDSLPQWVLESEWGVNCELCLQQLHVLSHYLFAPLPHFLNSILKKCYILPPHGMRCWCENFLNGQPLCK